MKRTATLILFALVALAAWRWLRPPAESAPEVPPIEAVLARERAVAHFERGDLAAARAELAPLVSMRRPELEDLVRAATVEFAGRPGSDPQPWFERIRRLDHRSPELHFMQARIALDQGRFEDALGHFRSVREVRPDDLATRVGMAATLSDLGRAEEARPLLAEVVALGVERGGVWHVQAVYHLWQIALHTEPPENARELQQLYEQLERLGYGTADVRVLDQGELARLRPPRTQSIAAAGAPRPPHFTAEPVILPELAGTLELSVHDLDGDGDLDFLAATPRALVAAMRTAEGYGLETILEGAVRCVRAFDLGNRDSLDLLLVRDGAVVLLEHRSGADLLLGDAGAARWMLSPLVLPSTPTPPEDLTLVDFDHDGDLDVLLAGSFGARLWRNDGAGPRPEAGGGVVRGSFVDASQEAGLPRELALSWCTSEDFDNDSDVDLLLGGPGGTFLMDNLRAGKFADVSRRVLGGALGMDRAPVVADFDADARPDLFAPGVPSTLWRQGADGTFAAERTALEVPPGARAVASDLDLDGITDLVWPAAQSAFAGSLAFASPVERAFSLPGDGRADAPWIVADLDRDLDNDLARITDQGLEILRCRGPVGHAARLQPLGLKDNRRAVGAVLEARTRGLYRRIYWRGEPELVGCGTHPKLDVVRTTWPNGAVQTMLDVPPTDQPFLDTEAGGLVQSSSLIGSCPFLYAWDGTQFQFVSDVLGVTPLGLPMAPGMLVPPDHDEHVLVRADQLVARDGRFELQITEELREVTYLDRIRLDVVDHPRNTQVHPNERFSFPPFPEPHVHTVRDPLPPVRATGSDGEDWTSALAVVDDVHAVPFEPLEPQFLGLATPHWLELEFDPARVRDAKRLRLVCTGWFFWTDASVNMASARTPGVSFVPPVLQLPAADGTWRDAGPPLGFPAGKSKTMVIELDDLLDRERPRLRLFSTLRLYWDATLLAVDEDDAPLRVTPLEPLGAHLWSRGFSRAVAEGRADLPERFDWNELAPEPRWNQHPGRYTRYGETAPLLGDIDDRFVILGSGDALTVRFDATRLPALPEGWTRDYMVFLDGWAKDRDPNTLEALEVEPLPFHAMAAYPYGPDQSFPTTPEHEAWRAEWNTREGKNWIAPLSPRREAEWARDLLR